MERYELSSEIAFYGGEDGPRNTAGPHLFGRGSLMYEYWFPRGLEEGRTLLLVGRTRSDLDSPEVEEHAERLDPIQEIDLTRNGSPAGRVFWRLAYSYRANPGSAGASRVMSE
jgi:hypothetical protein